MVSRIIMCDPHDGERTTNEWTGLELIKQNNVDADLRFDILPVIIT